MSKQILLINDMAGYGKVALSAMIPVLSHMRHHIYNLPTALVSNTLDYGKFDILETTDYMEHTMKIWDFLLMRYLPDLLYRKGRQSLWQNSADSRAGKERESLWIRSWGTKESFITA